MTRSLCVRDQPVIAASFVLNYLRMYHFLSLGNGLCCPRMAKKNRCAGIWKSRSPAASLDPYLPKNTSNCGTYSEPDPLCSLRCSTRSAWAIRWLWQLEVWLVVVWRRWRRWLRVRPFMQSWMRVGMNGICGRGAVCRVGLAQVGFETLPPCTCMCGPTVCEC